MLLLAVVVPFRPQRGANRAEQLQALTARLARVLDRFDARVFVVEQSQDGRRFNRGQLLNSGVLLAEARGGASAVCFHDVDLLPGADSEPHYRDDGTAGPLHIGSGFARYAAARDSFFGGILLLSWADVLTTNGYPNTFWGWGGEDDAFGDRCKRLHLTVRRPCTTVVDMECDGRGAPLTVDAKLQRLRRERAMSSGVAIGRRFALSRTPTGRGIREQPSRSETRPPSGHGNTSSSLWVDIYS